MRLVLPKDRASHPNRDERLVVPPYFSPASGDLMTQISFESRFNELLRLELLFTPRFLVCDFVPAAPGRETRSNLGQAYTSRLLSIPFIDTKPFIAI